MQVLVQVHKSDITFFESSAFQIVVKGDTDEYFLRQSLVEDEVEFPGFVDSAVVGV